MAFSKQEVEHFDGHPGEKQEEKKELQRIRKRGSFLNFDVEDTNEVTVETKPVK